MLLAPSHIAFLEIPLWALEMSNDISAGEGCLSIWMAIECIISSAPPFLPAPICMGSSFSLISVNISAMALWLLLLYVTPMAIGLTLSGPLSIAIILALRRQADPVFQTTLFMRRLRRGVEGLGQAKIAYLHLGAGHLPGN